MGLIGIKNVKIVDGTGGPSYLGDVLIDGEEISGVLPTNSLHYLEDEEDVMIIDGSGRVLTPGFIDTHSHSDLEILEDPYLEPKIRQGITSEILGQDGISMAPLPKEFIYDWQRNISGLDGSSKNISWEYETIDNYLKMIEDSQSCSNSGYLIPHGNVRLQVLGFEEEDPTPIEIQEMKEIVRDGMESGCLGLSSGLIYIPCAYSKEEELVELCKVVADYDGVFVVHQRSEAGQILKSMDEIIRIGLKSGVKIHFSHFKICGKRNWKLLNKVLGKLDLAKAKGVQVSFDMYPYTAGSTMLSAILPPWMHVGGTYDMLKRLNDYGIRRMLRKELKKNYTKWDNFVSFAGMEGIYITNVGSAANENVIGLNLVELGKMKKMNPFEATFDLLIDEKNEVGMIDYYGYEEHLKTFIKREEMNGCTDGLLGGKPHPRAYGAFPKIIHKYVNEEQVITLEEAIHKFCGKPAQLFGLKGRGIIKDGYFADLLLIDELKIKDKGTYLNPKQFPEGIEMVMVNGAIVFDGHNNYKTSSGKVLRRHS